MKRLFVFLYSLMLLILFSCSGKYVEETQNKDDLIEITKDQFEVENMVLGKPEIVMMQEKIPFTGKIVFALNGVVKVNAPMEGIVKNIYVKNEQEVSKNQVLVEVGGGAVIDLQKSYALSEVKIKQLKTNYNRAKVLYQDNIRTEKDFIQAESEYNAELANYNALKIKMANAGIRISDIKQGKYVSSYQIKARISGSVTNVKVVVGQFVDKESEMMEVVNRNNIELQLSLYEKDVKKIKKGQKVLLANMNDNNTKAQAIISRIGNQLNISSNSVSCYADIDTSSIRDFVINQVVTGEVITTSDSVLAVPKTSVFTIGENQFIALLKDKNEEGYSFQKLKINTGSSDSNYVEIKDVPKTANILLKGTYNLSME